MLLSQCKCRPHTSSKVNQMIMCKFELGVLFLTDDAVAESPSAESAAALLKVAADGQAVVPKGELFKALRALEKARLKVGLIEIVSMWKPPETHNNAVWQSLMCRPGHLTRKRIVHMQGGDDGYELLAGDPTHGKWWRLIYAVGMSCALRVEIPVGHPELFCRCVHTELVCEHHCQAQRKANACTRSQCTVVKQMLSMIPSSTQST